VEPVEALTRIASLLERRRDPRYRVEAFRRAAIAIRDVPTEELRHLAVRGRLRDLPNVGDTTATVIAEALTGKTPTYLERLEQEVTEPGSDAGNAIRAALRGDLHVHSDWSDGGDTIRTMAERVRTVGHEYFALTDHSPRLKIAHGLSPERLREQLDVIAELNQELADNVQPLRILSGIEVDINDDGSLDQEPELLAEIDVVVASVHSKLRMDKAAMTYRLVAAMAHPHSDILGHCTGRLVTGRGRPESEFDVGVVLAACLRFDKALEINCRPERLDPPRRILRQAVEMGVKVSIDTDSHAAEQLEWQPFGTDRAAECGVPVETIVNSWPVEELLAWTASHGSGEPVAVTSR
jgi:Histidinol phosphatase and related hydrolases of the PHP family